jgi:hypothetical protein
MTNVSQSKLKLNRKFIDPMAAESPRNSTALYRPPVKNRKKIVLLNTQKAWINPERA